MSTTAIDREAARDLLIDLVETPSPTGEEGVVADRLQAFFESQDREAYVDEVGNLRAPGDDTVLLTSHMDTVPGDIPVRVEDDEDGPVLWGRGSVDAKGSLAALAVVAARTGASFAGVVGEEVDSAGARHLIETRDTPGAVVNGEPSGWEGITLGYRGLLGGRYVATSESGHSSRPANNAIQDAIAWWSNIEAEFESDEWEPVFEQVTPKPTSIDGGLTDDGLSVETTMDVQLRVPPDMTTEELVEIANGYLDVADRVNWNDRVEPVMQSPRTTVARAFRTAIRAEGGDPRLLRKTGTSDMNVFANAWDCPMVTYGPGDSDLDHAPDEHLPLAAFDRSVAVIERAVGRL